MPKHELQEALEQAGYECRSYSGRGMFGKSCLAVSTLKGNEVLILEGVSSKLRQLAAHPMTDSLGKGLVLYWPSVPYSEGSLSGTEEGAKVRLEMTATQHADILAYLMDRKETHEGALAYLMDMKEKHEGALKDAYEGGTGCEEEVEYELEHTKLVAEFIKLIQDAK